MNSSSPEGVFPGSLSENPAAAALGDPVYVQLWQRVPPDEDGEWKDTGLGISGTLVDGPQSRLRDHAHGRFWYVMPDEKLAYHEPAYANAHPRQFSDGSVELRYGEGESACVETVRFVVVAMAKAVGQKGAN